LASAGIPFTITVADIYVTSGSIIPSATGVNGSFTFFVMPSGVTNSTLLSGTILSTVGNVKTDNYPSLQAYVQNGVLHINGLSEGAEWRVYNVMGTLIYSSVANAPETTMPLPARGVYIVTDGKTTVKVVNCQLSIDNEFVIRNFEFVIVGAGSARPYIHYRGAPLRSPN